MVEKNTKQEFSCLSKTGFLFKIGGLKQIWYNKLQRYVLMGLALCKCPYIQDFLTEKVGAIKTHKPTIM